MEVESQVNTGLSEGEVPKINKKRKQSALSRISKYVVVRLITLFITVVIGVYLTIMIANMGGYVDNIMKGEIRESIGMRLLNDQNYKQMKTLNTYN